MSLYLKILVFSFLIIRCTTNNEEVQKPDIVSNNDLKNWNFKSQREEIEPKHFIDENIIFENSPTLALAGDGKFFSNGQWFKDVDVEPGRYYYFSVYYKEKNVEEPNRCILVKIDWLDGDGNRVTWPEYPRKVRDTDKDDWNLIEQTYLVPDKTVKARIVLVFRWDADGKVNFGGITSREVQKPEPRIVRIATVHYRPRNGKTRQDNLDQFVPFIQEAASENADIVCLPEGVTMAGTGMSYIAASESIPGPTTEFLGKMAKENSIYIVSGILEREGPVVYNSAILIDRNGDFAGKYRKLSVPREEIEGGITPGDGLPVFDTDFGRIGMMICMDSFFPEQARTLTMKGAEVIFLPIWGGILELMKARAIENQVYLVSSSFDTKSAIFDQEGKILAEATEDDRVVVVDIDLEKQKLWPWLGDFKNRIPREIASRKALGN
jgi:predicted amidohydrolase